MIPKAPPDVIADAIAGITPVHKNNSTTLKCNTNKICHIEKLAGGKLKTVVVAEKRADKFRRGLQTRWLKKNITKLSADEIARKMEEIGF